MLNGEDYYEKDYYTTWRKKQAHLKKNRNQSVCTVNKVQEAKKKGALLM